MKKGAKNTDNNMEAVVNDSLVIQFLLI